MAIDTTVSTDRTIDDSNLAGIGGWLLLVAIGLIFSPIRMVMQFWPLYQTVYFDGVTWQALNDTSSSTYVPYLAELIVVETVLNAMLLAAALVLIVMFFTRRRVFPKLYIALAVASIVVLVGDALVGGMLLSEAAFDPDTAKEIARSLVGAAIWIPYMLVSRRVKATFTR
ncbi:MAG: DUF2569 domain-containing protein [Hyphomicrobiaceae bacterium]